MRGGNFLNWAERASALVRQMNEADPVSYTHLDVYKRQRRSYVRGSRLSYRDLFGASLAI